MKNILIIGCGLLGSSLLRKIQKKKLAKRIYIYEKSKSNIVKIKKLKLPGILVNKIEEGVKKSDLKFFWFYPYVLRFYCLQWISIIMTKNICNCFIGYLTFVNI